MHNKNNMNKETKIYSDFIKQNKVKVTKWGYEFRGEEVRVYKSDESKWWYSEIHQENCYTKKSAIYWCLRNRFESINSIIQ